MPIIVLGLEETRKKYAEDTPYDPATRLTFHICVIAAAIIGARLGTISNVKYEDVSLPVVRNPKNHSKKGLVVAPTIRKNKLQRKATRVSRALSLSFALNFIPYKLLCLANARTSKELLNPVLLEGDVNAVPLHWKEHTKGLPIWKISATIFYALWGRVNLVAALLTLVPGVLSEAVRNYVLSHTTQVSQTSYQTHVVRENLTEKDFEEKAGFDGALVGSMRNMTLNRDENAPVDPTADEPASFEERRDMTGFRAKADYRIDTLLKLKVKDSREKYFADRKKNSNPAVAEINQFLQETADDLLESNEYSEHFITLLVNYLAYRGRSSSGPVSKIRKSHVGPKFSDGTISKDAKLYRCPVLRS
ncbi:MAG: hypothetical protein Q9207_003711 [Kuettlingeria erythrocarpa]